MPESSLSAICDAFSRELLQFDSFLEQLQHNWSRETPFIADKLDQYARHVWLVARHFREKELNVTTHESICYADVLSLPVLPPSPSAIQDEIRPPSPRSSPCLAAGEICTDPLVIGDVSTSLDGHVLPDTLSWATMSTTEGEVLSNSRLRSVVREDVTRTTSTWNDDFQSGGGVGSGTIDPARLRLDLTRDLRSVEQDVAVRCSAIPCSSRSIAPKDRTGSYKMLGCKRKALPQVATPDQRQTSRRKRPRLRWQMHHTENAQQHSVSGDPGLRREVIQRLEGSSHEQVQTICDLYSAIASPDSILQLRDVITTARMSENWALSCNMSSIVNTVHMLDKVDTLHQSAAFLRRILLLRLADHRDRLVDELREDLQSAPNTSQSTASGKVASLVLDNLMVQAYPHTARLPEENHLPKWRQKHEVERKALTNRLTAARNWRMAAKPFKFGIIALVPTGGVFQIQNQNFETLREKSCRVLLDLLKKKGSGYVFQAAKLLTPFVQAIYDGKTNLPRLRVESLAAGQPELMDPSKVVELCEEVPSDEEERDFLAQ